MCPKDLAVWGIDSGVRHSVGGGDYGSVRVGAFMGYRIIAELSGLPVNHAGDSVVISDPGWEALANLSPSEFEESFANRLPERILGEEFMALRRTTDSVTSIERSRTYAVRAPTAHPVYESARVNKFAELLQVGREGSIEDVPELLGELMYESPQAIRLWPRFARH